MNKNDLNSSVFTGKVRTRVCGILVEDDRILLLRHKGVGKLDYLWSPPGGGINFGETTEAALIREFREETHLEVCVEEFLFVNEYIDSRFHAIELFYRVRKKSGDLSLGHDPELSVEDQMLTDFRFFSSDDISSTPQKAIHNAFHTNNSVQKLLKLRGLVSFSN